MIPAASARLSHLPDFDPDSLHTAIQDSRLEHLQLDRGRFEGRIAHSASTDSRIDWGAYRLSLLSRGELSRDRVTLAMAVAGQGDWRVQAARLERAFRETFGVSPRRYLTLLRLAAVRRELLRHEAGASVTQVATRWGFFHLGRFGQDYKAQFGESPSQTLRAAG